MYPPRRTEQDDGRSTRRTFLRTLAGVSGAALVGQGVARAQARDRDPDSERSAERLDVRQGPAQTTDPCPLPRFTDPYLGFRVGRIPEWRVWYSGGVIWQLPPEASDGDGSAAFVYPGWLRGSTVEDVADAFVTGYNDYLAADGQSSDRLVRQGSSLSGTVLGDSVSGDIWTWSDGQFGLVWGGWAPAAEWSARRDTVAQTGQCYQQGASMPLTVERVVGTDDSGAVAEWEYAVPPGWNAAGATSNAIQIMGEPDEQGLMNGIIGYIFFNNMTGTFSHETLIEWWDGQNQNWEILELGEGRTVGSFTDPLGLSWELRAYGITTTYGYEPATGVMGVAVTHDSWAPGEYTSVQFWTREAVLDRWEALTAITERIQNSIQMVGYQVGQNVAPPTGLAVSVADLAWDVYAANSAVHDYTGTLYSDALLGNDRVVHPTYPDVELVVPSNTFEPGQCPDGYRPAPDPFTGDVLCMPLVTGP